MSLLKFKNGNVWTNLQLGADNIAANAINASKIVDGSIGTAELANNAVTSAKIADGTIAAGDLSAALLKRITDLEANFVRARQRKDYNNGGFLEVNQIGHLVFVVFSVGDKILAPWKDYAVDQSIKVPDPITSVNVPALSQNANATVMIHIEDHLLKFFNKSDVFVEPSASWLFADFVYFTDDLSGLNLSGQGK